MTSVHVLLKKIEYVFNKIALNLIKEVKDKDVEFKKKLRKNYSVFDKKSESHIHYFIQQLDEKNIGKEQFTKPYSDDILVNDNVMSLEILKEINVYDIIQIVSDKEKDVVKCYLYIFYMLTYLYSETTLIQENVDEDKINELDLLFGKCLKLINATQEVDMNVELDNILDDDLKTLLENIYESRNIIKESIMKYENEELDGNEEDDANPSLDTAYDYLHNSKIGALAKEISEDIDISKINVENPEQLLNIDSIFSGNNNALGDIIGKVGTKIAGKIQNGEIKQDELMQEAFTMMSKLNGTNSFMENMMKNVMNNQQQFNPSPADGNNNFTRKSKKQAQLRKRLEEKNRNKS